MFHLRRGSMFLQGALELLNSEGEWAVRDGVLYYYPYARYGVPPSSLDGDDGEVITAPVVQRVFSFVGSSAERPVAEITLQGLVVIGASMPRRYAAKNRTAVGRRTYKVFSDGRVSVSVSVRLCYVDIVNTCFDS